MPIYEYKCENGHVFDAIQKFSDDPLSECVECGAPAVRVLSAPAIHFKGSGFHNTDYGTRKGGPSKDGGKDGGGSESKSSDSKSSDSKPKDSGSKSGDSKPKAAAASD